MEGGLGLGPVLRRHFGGRQSGFTSALLVFPLFLGYQVAILLGAQGRNGADFITLWLIRLCDRDLAQYLLLLASLAVGYVGVLLWLRRRRTLHGRMFGPMLVESSVYAFFMGGVIQLLMIYFDRLVPILAIGATTPLDVLAISAGAGLHEELVFRAGLLAGLMRLFALPLVPLGRLGGGLIALLISSLVFSAVHHVGPGAEAFTTVAFTYRTFAGAIFGVIYLYRGLAVAAWTHALYDVLVLSTG